MFNFRVLQPLWIACLYVQSRPNLKYLSRPLNWFRYKPSKYLSCREKTLNSRVNVKKFKFPVRWISFYAFLHATSTAALKNEEPKKEELDFDTLIFEADDLFDQYKYSEVVELLQNLKECGNADVLWRLCRALYYLSREEKSGKSRCDLINESYSLAERALEIDDGNYAVHKWYSVLLDEHAFTRGFRARLGQITNVKHHMMRAMELNPKDATTLYMLGSWCFGVTDLPWYQRQIVIALVGSFPTSSFEEALFYFKKAEEINPRFYSLNLLMLGKTYLKLKDVEEARHYLTLASTYPARSDEDQQANKEALDLLKQLPT